MLSYLELSARHSQKFNAMQMAWLIGTGRLNRMTDNAHAKEEAIPL